MMYNGDMDRGIHEECGVFGIYSQKLADLAPTILYLMGIDIPEEMTGEVLMK